mgnify:FL=1
MRNKQSESQLQQNCVKWFRYQYPELRKNLFAIPNGGIRNIATARRLKGEGVVAGVADMFLAVGKDVSGNLCFEILQENGLRDYLRGFHGLFIEMKYGYGKQTPEQFEFEMAVNTQGYKYVVCRTFDEFKEKIEEYLRKRK